jgi:hypothetical protein
MITSIFSNDTKLGAFVAIAETDAAGNAVASSGPFAIAVDDPSSLVTVTPGSADNSTPTRITANGNGGVGSVTVTVTDQSNTAVGKASLAIVAPPPPPPPPVPTLAVSFEPGT